MRVILDLIPIVLVLCSGSGSGVEIQDTKGAWFASCHFLFMAAVPPCGSDFYKLNYRGSWGTINLTLKCITIAIPGTRPIQVIT